MEDIAKQINSVISDIQSITDFFEKNKALLSNRHEINYKFCKQLQKDIDFLSLNSYSSFALFKVLKINYNFNKEDNFQDLNSKFIIIKESAANLKTI